MKRIINLIFLIMAFGILNSQSQTIILEGGYFNPKRVGATTSETYFDAIRLGGLTEFGLKYNFGVQTGLLYNLGYSHKIQRYSMSSDSVVYKTWSHALEIPLRLVYNQPLFKDFKLFGFIGPNIQVGLFQPQQVDANLSDALTDMTGIHSGKYNIYKVDATGKNWSRINVQIGAGGGVQWRKFLLKSGYDWGLNNLDQTKSDYVRQGNWYVSFGYQIQ
jgi:hypothetical protein